MDSGGSGIWRFDAQSRSRAFDHDSPETGNRKPETVPLALRPEKDPEQKADEREQDQDDDPDEADEYAHAGLGGLDDGPDENDQPDQAKQTDFGTHGVLLQVNSTTDYSRSQAPSCGFGFNQRQRSGFRRLLQLRRRRAALRPGRDPKCKRRRQARTRPHARRRPVVPTRRSGTCPAPSSAPGRRAGTHSATPLAYPVGA